MQTTKKTTNNGYNHFKKCSEVISTLFGIEYKLGSATEKNRLDCFKALALYVEGVYGDKIPLSYNGVSYNKCCDIYGESSIKAMKLFSEYIKHNFTDIKNNNIFVGDIMLFYNKKDIVESVGISAGNSKAVVVTKERGAIMIITNYYDHHKGYRWQQRYL